MRHFFSTAMYVFVVLFLAALVACSDNFVGMDDEVAFEDAFGKKSGMSQLKLPAGEAAIIFSFPDVGGAPTPEGITFDRQGNMFVSNRTGPSGNWTQNLVEKITPNGSHSIVADLGPSGECPGFSGILGLTTDPKGNVFAAFGSCTSEYHGVVKIDRMGNVSHLAGSEAMILPNSLTFDSRGNLYVTDSFGSTVWRYGDSKLPGKRKAFEVWVSDPLLAPDFSSPIPVGANGIAYKAPHDLYVANTARNGLVHIPVLPNGDAGTPENIILTGPEFWMYLFPDGLALDAHGMLYAAIPPAGTPPPPGVPDSGIPFSPVVKIDPGTGFVTPMIAPFLPGGPGSELFDTVTSLAFGSSPRDHKSVFTVSGDLFGTPTGSGAVITQVGVGVPGAKGQ